MKRRFPAHVFGQVGAAPINSLRFCVVLVSEVTPAERETQLVGSLRQLRDRRREHRSGAIKVPMALKRFAEKC